VFRAVGGASVTTGLRFHTPAFRGSRRSSSSTSSGGRDPKGGVGHVGNLVDPNVEVHQAICRRGVHRVRSAGRAGDTAQVPMVMKLIGAAMPTT
jgi:hypothetical protein